LTRSQSWVRAGALSTGIPPAAVVRAAAAGLLLLTACSGGGSAKLDEVVPAAVEAVPARAGSLPVEEELSGVVRALNQVAIRPEINAVVMEVLVHNGDPVTAGQPMIRLDDEALRERLRSAEAQLRVAEANAVEAEARIAELRAQVVRSRALAAEGLTSELELETFEAQLDALEAAAGQAAAQVEQADATVEERRSAVGKATVCAPVAGVVGRRDVEVGMVVNPASLLFVVGDLDELVVEVSLTQEMLAHIAPGTPVEIDDRGSDTEPVAATISRISPFLETESFSTTAEIDLPATAAGFRPGMFVEVRVLIGRSTPATLLPSSAIWENPLTGDRVVFVVVDDDGLVEPEAPSDEIPDRPRAVEMRPVEVLAEGSGTVGVRGADEGDWVVTLGQHLLQEQVDAADGFAVKARVRPTSWSRVLELAGLQREDLLTQFLAKQRVIARTLGAELPESTAQVDEALRAAAEADAVGGGSR